MTTILLWRAGVMWNCFAACSIALFSLRCLDGAQRAEHLAHGVDAPAGHQS